MRLLLLVVAYSACLTLAINFGNSNLQFSKNVIIQTMPHSRHLTDLPGVDTLIFGTVDCSQA
jgi:hypothetical protein